MAAKPAKAADGLNRPEKIGIMVDLSTRAEMFGDTLQRLVMLILFVRHQWCLLDYRQGDISVCQSQMPGSTREATLQHCGAHGRLKCAVESLLDGVVRPSVFQVLAHKANLCVRLP